MSEVDEVASGDDENIQEGRRSGRMLTRPCACHGSMSSVHEDCLVKWLKYKNISHCELCLTKFIIKEEHGSFF